jgi:hypothetical protein
MTDAARAGGQSKLDNTLKGVFDRRRPGDTLPGDQQYKQRQWSVGAPLRPVFLDGRQWAWQQTLFVPDRAMAAAKGSRIERLRMAVARLKDLPVESVEIVGFEHCDRETDPQLKQDELAEGDEPPAAGGLFVCLWRSWYVSSDLLTSKKQRRVGIPKAAARDARDADCKTRHYLVTMMGGKMAGARGHPLSRLPGGTASSAGQLALAAARDRDR